MSRRSTLGRRNECFFVRMHPEELNDLTRRAAQHGLSRADYARMRLLEEAVPALPAAVPTINYQTAAALVALRHRIHALHVYCASGASINWDGQEEQGRHLYETFNDLKRDIERVVKAIPDSL